MRKHPECTKLTQVVTSVAAGTAAARCGFDRAVGWILTHVDDIAVETTADIKSVTEGKTEMIFTFMVCGP